MTYGLDYYDIDGEPIDSGRAFDLRYGPGGEISEYARIGLDHIVAQPGVRVSTVWLGLDHAFDQARPLIFETMVFGGGADGTCFRYATKQAAFDGHWEVVNNLELGRDPFEGMEDTDGDV